MLGKYLNNVHLYLLTWKCALDTLYGKYSLSNRMYCINPDYQVYANREISAKKSWYPPKQC